MTHCITIWLTLLTTPLWALSSISVEERLHNASRFNSAEFTQERHIEVLDRALVSTGTVTLTAAGFTWEQKTPFRNTLTFDGVSIVETSVIGEQQISRALHDPATGNMTRTLFHMMSGSWDRMRSGFELSQESPDNAMTWQLKLVPLEPQIRAVIPSISVAGTRHLERIQVQQADGGSTLIRLDNHQSTP